MTINQAVFDKMIDGREKNMAAVSPIMEDYCFGSIRGLNTFVSNTYDYRVLVSVEDSKVILHTGFTKKVKTALIEKASAKLMELNAKYGFQLGVDVGDGEVTYDHTFLLRAKPVTEEIFSAFFSVYLRNIDACVHVLRKEMREFYPSLLDDDDDEPDFHQRLRSLLESTDDDSDDFDISDLEFDFSGEDD